jgi:hypothetical protein
MFKIRINDRYDLRSKGLVHKVTARVGWR